MFVFFLITKDTSFTWIKIHLSFSSIAEGTSLLDGASAFIFHQPYYKLVMKSFARLMLNDFLTDRNPDYKGRYAGLEAFR